MADGPESLPVIDPETREGRAVSIVTDRALIVRAFENGWIDDVETSRDLLRECREDMAAYRAINPPLDELLDRSIALAKVGQGNANVTAKAIATAERQQPTPGVVNNTQIINVTTTKALESEHGRNAITQLRRALCDGEPAAVGKA